MPPSPTSGVPPILDVLDVAVEYGGVPALSGVSLSIAPGEVVAIVGPNGAGKSTLLKAIMRVEPLSSGDIIWRGNSLIPATPDKVARSGIAYVPEGRHIFGELTVEENLRLGAISRPSSSTDLAEARGWVASLFPVIAEGRNRHAGLLSGGQQQQLAIARALLADPDLLLLDEPSLGLAPLIIDAVFESIAEIRDAGTAVLLVEQRAQKAMEFADRSLVLAGGLIADRFGDGRAIDQDRVRAAYFDHSSSQDADG